MLKTYPATLLAPKCSASNASHRPVLPDKLLPDLIISSFLVEVPIIFSSVVGMGPKITEKAKLESAHSFMFTFCF